MSARPIVKFVGKLVFRAEGQLHIGGAREGNVLYALRLPDGRLLIPASTWKGALRALAEKLAPTLPANGLERLAIERVARVQDPSEARRSVSDLLEDFRAALEGKGGGRFDPADVREKLLLLGYDLERVEDPAWALAQYLMLYCPVGGLFGNWARSGGLRFFDTVLDARTQRRPGVGIDRKTGTVRENILYFVEASEAGIEVPLVIAGELEGRGSAPARLLASLLEAVEVLGLSIGGRKSVGLGFLTLERACFHAFELGGPRDERGTLLANPLKAPPMSLKEFTEWLRGRT